MPLKGRRVEPIKATGPLIAMMTKYFDTGPQRRSGPLKPEKVLESPIFID